MDRRDLELRARVSALAARLGIELREDWRGCDAVWPLLERMRREGAVVLIKLDGLRNPASGDTGPYTAVVSGPRLGEDGTRRTDQATIEAALSQVILHGAARCWEEVGGAS